MEANRSVVNACRSSVLESKAKWRDWQRPFDWKDRAEERSDWREDRGSQWNSSVSLRNGSNDQRRSMDVHRDWSLRRRSMGWEQCASRELSSYLDDSCWRSIVQYDKWIEWEWIVFSVELSHWLAFEDSLPLDWKTAVSIDDRWAHFDFDSIRRDNHWFVN